MSVIVLSVSQSARRLFVIDAALGVIAAWIAAPDESVLAAQQCVSAFAVRKTMVRKTIEI